MNELQKREVMGRTKKAAAGWMIGGVATLFVPTMAALIALVVLLITFGLDAATFFTFGAALGIAAVLLFKPLIVTALVVGAVVLVIIALTTVFLGSRAASPPSNR